MSNVDEMEAVRREAGLPPRKTYRIVKTTPEELQRRAARIKPVMMLDGALHFLQPCHLENVAYTWDAKKADLAPGFRTLGEFTCLHTYGYYGFFKPSIAEVLWQMPEHFLTEAVAFEITNQPHNATDLNEEREATNAGFHVSTVRVYA